MIPSFIITFRETLEAALVVGIILAYLKKTERTKYNRIVYIGLFVAVIASILGMWLFNYFAGGFTGQAEEVFEGITMLVGAILITTLILWMMSRKNMVLDLEEKVETELTKSQTFGLFSVVFISVLREGIETVIFLGATSVVSTENNLLGALLGIVGAIILGYLIFVNSIKFNFKKFFFVTGLLLIIFAAGLTAHGVHELQEAGVVPVYQEEVWDINPEVTEEGEYPLLHENGYIGSILKGLVGYNGNPSLLEVLAYLGYWAVLLPIISIRYSKKN